MWRNTAGQSVDGLLVSATDGTAVTSGASVSVRKGTGSFAAGGGTLAHSTSGVWLYQPTQAETDADRVSFLFTATGAVPQLVQVFPGITTQDLVDQIITELISQVATSGEVAADVRDELATELARVDVAVSSRLASASYSAAPTASTTASAVRTELTTELGRIDATISSRLAGATYTAPPTAAANAAAVLAAATADPLAANVKEINDTALAGNGSSQPWGPA